MDASIASLADRLLSDLKTKLGAEWQKFTVDQQQLALDCCLDAAALTASAMAAATPEAQAALAKELAQVNAQLANLGAATAVTVAPIFWQILQAAITSAISLAIAAA